MTTDIAAALLAANEAFYDAFGTGDTSAMDALWAREHAVACLHPGAAPVFGREDVVGSWIAILSNPNRPAIQCANAEAIAFAESGLVICHEVLSGGRLVATNAFVTENGVWRMVHHHAGPMNMVG